MNGVLEIMNYAAPYAGNFIASVQQLCSALRDEGRQVVLVFPAAARDRAWITALREQDLPVFFLPQGFAGKAALLRRLCRQYDVGVVHTHFIDRAVYLPLRAACIGKRIPHVFHAHSLPRYPSGGLRLGLRRGMMHASRVICVSDAVRQAYEQRGFARCITVPNGIDFARLDNAQPVSLPERSVLMFGYDVHIKGVDTALDAFAALDDTHRYTLCIAAAGHGAQTEAFLRARFGTVPEWVRVLPARQDVGAYYRASDVFLSASRSEGFAYAVTEAAYCGCPLALSDLPAHREQALPQAEYFPPDTPQALFAAVERAAAIVPDGRNREAVCARFALPVWARKVCAILTEAIRE